jgi:hypothetical protein
VKSTITPRDDELATAQPGCGFESGTVVVVVAVVVVVGVVAVWSTTTNTRPTNNKGLRASDQRRDLVRRRELRCDAAFFGVTACDVVLTN